MEPRIEDKTMRFKKHNNSVNERWVFLTPMVNTTFNRLLPLLYSIMLTLCRLTIKRWGIEKMLSFVSSLTSFMLIFQSMVYVLFNATQYYQIFLQVNSCKLHLTTDKTLVTLPDRAQRTVSPQSHTETLCG